MNNLFMILFMIFMHIIDDYFIQSACLNKLKQKNWWIETYSSKQYEKYKYDYIIGLLMHSLSWSFCIMLPIALKMSFTVSYLFGIVFLLNVIIHATIDDLKANKGKISLVEDQIIHILQILITYGILKI